MDDMVPCACLCGQMISARRSNGKPRRFAYRHRLDPHIAEAWGKLFLPDESQTPECWEWPGATHMRSGYGMTRKNGENYAHRAAWAQVNGPVPSGLNVLHKCDNPPCFRPSHLFLGTQRDNLEDMAAKGRARNGARPNQVDELEAIAAYQTGDSLLQLANRYHTSNVHIRCVLVAAGVQIRKPGTRGAIARRQR